MQPKKSLGQNFLRDPKILKKIADFARIDKGDTVVEVGPGEGTLTSLLLNQAGKVIAIEKDEELAVLLKEKFREEILDGKLEIIVEDILNYELRIMNYVLVGNIPYNITGALFRRFLERTNPPKSITFVIQREVAERILARDGKESILSISIKAYGKPEYGGLIKAGSFYPAPKVDSAIISIRDITKQKFEEITHSLTNVWPLSYNKREEIEKRFFEILRLGFAHKRKLLIKNLRISKTFFEKCQIPEKARAEDLKVADWITLTKELSKN